MLSYFLLNDMEIQLKNKNVELSPKSVLKELAKCQIDHIKVTSTNQTNYQLTVPTQEQIQLLKLFDGDVLIKKTHVKQVLKKVQNWV